MPEVEDMAYQSTREQLPTRDNPLSWDNIVDLVIDNNHPTGEEVSRDAMLSLLEGSTVSFAPGNVFTALNATADSIREGMPRDHQLQAFVVSTEGRLSTLGFTKERAKSSRGAFSQLASKVHMTSFTGFSPRPSSQEVAQGIIQAFRSGAEAIVAIGGGSSIDMGKAIDVGLHDSEIQDALSQLETIGDEA